LPAVDSNFVESKTALFQDGFSREWRLLIGRLVTMGISVFFFAISDYS